MKFIAIVLATAVAAEVTAVTDKLLFEYTLRDFTAARNRHDPSSVDWTSDGCTNSPDNPFQFPFLPGCHRHDFGYRNYEIQERLTDDNRKKIDVNFQKDLHLQCEQVYARMACRALANVYFGAVRLFGGLAVGTGKRDEAAMAEYKKLVALYEDEVRKAQEIGDLPLLQ